MRPELSTSRWTSLVPFLLLGIALHRSTDHETVAEYSARKASSLVQAFSVTPISRRAAIKANNNKIANSRCWSSPMNNEQEEKEEKPLVQRTSFDQAGKSLVEEEDKKRLDSMGDFDSNPNANADDMEKVRAAIRARTTNLGIEKSKVSAEYIQKKKEQAISAGSARAASENNDMFGGLDLSQIRTEATPSRSSSSPWADEDGEVPSMFYEPQNELSEQEQAEADPLGQKTIAEQWLYEFQQIKWPGPGSALREIGLMLVVVVITAALVIGWDKVLRDIYTEVLHFIPSKEDMANYANRFAGLELPAGWTDNMNDEDVASFAETVNSVGRGGGMSDL